MTWLDIYRKISLLPSVLALTLVGSNLARAQGTNHQFNEDSRNILTLMASINTVSTLTGAESYGSLGSDIGLGVITLNTTDSPLLRSGFYHDEPETSASTDPILPRLTIVKGLMIPVDISSSLAVAEQGRIHQAGLAAKWTFFEGFKLPAFGLFTYWSTVESAHQAKLQSSGIGVVGSLAWRSILKFYVSMSSARHSGEVMMPEQLQALYLNAEQLDESFRHQWSSIVQTAGINITVLPPFVKTAIEVQKSTGADSNVYLAKMSIGT